MQTPSGFSVTPVPLTSAPPVPRRSKMIHFEYTSPIGWYYAGVLPLPAVKLKLRKDISSSRPGEAKLVTTLVGQLPLVTAFADDNPGRPGGPTLNAVPGGLLVPESSQSLEVNENNGQTVGPCESISGSTFTQAIQCTLTASYGTSNETADSPESSVNEAISDAGPMFYEFNFAYGNGWDPLQTVGAIGYDCVIYVNAAGTVQNDAHYSNSLCGRLRIRVR
jgi:hypothetical protein